MTAEHRGLGLGRRQFVQGAGLAGLGLLAGCGRLPPQSQQTAHIPRIGYLASGRSAPGFGEAAFRQGLAELGYVEGENLAIEWRFTAQAERLPDLAAELVRLGPDVLVAATSPAVSVAQHLTQEIPIVMPTSGDPVRQGFVTSLARPGGNITGLSILAPEISGKQLELLKEIVPTLGRVAVLGTSTVPGNAEALKATELAAEALKMQLQYLEVRDRKDIETALRTRARRVQRQSSRSRAASC
jgi:putative ABC transport system substrate-binding protein